MRLSHLLPATLLAVAGLTTANAADLTRIDRTLKDEPKYNTGAPKYCLLVFGPEAETRIWLVHDGDVVHVLDSPDGKSPRKWRQVKRQKYGSFRLGDIWDEGGKTRYEWLLYKPGGSYRTLSVRFGVKSQDAGEDRSGKLEFAASAKTSPVIHFNGPMTLDLWYEQRPLRRDRDEDLSVTIGTHGLGNGTFALCYTSATPDLACPTAVIEYPAKEKDAKPVVVRARITNDAGEFRYLTMRAPETAGSGIAKVTLSYDEWKAGKVKSAVIKVPVNPAPKK